MAGTPGRIQMTTRSEFAIIQATDDIKYPGQEDLSQVAGLPACLAERVVSRPPTGMRQVFNVYWDPDAEELVWEISETDA